MSGGSVKSINILGNFRHQARSPEENKYEKEKEKSMESNEEGPEDIAVRPQPAKKIL